MEERLLGTSGLRVSRLGLGTMTWSRDTDEHEAAEQLRDFVDAGGTLIDTAASYADGASEELLGSLLGTAVGRDEVLLCTKAGVRRTVRGGVVDASRGALLDSLDASLRRLRTDHVDLWLVQAPDPRTPLEETVSALRLAVSSGRARYVGLSNHPAWQTARAATLLEPDPGLAAVDIGVLAWSPLGRGVLTGKYQRSIPADSRAASPHLAGFVEPYLGPDHQPIVAAVTIAAEGLERSPLEVALAWVRDRPQVSCAIVGARTAAQLRAALATEDLELPDAILDALDEISAPDLGYPERR